MYIYTRGAALAMLASTVSRRITARASRCYNGSFWVCCAPVTIFRQRSPMSEVDRFVPYARYVLWYTLLWYTHAARDNFKINNRIQPITTIIVKKKIKFELV